MQTLLPNMSPKVSMYNAEKSLFIPPSQDAIPNLMSDLEKFLHNEDLSIPPLIRIGIAQYRFEMQT